MAEGVSPLAIRIGISHLAPETLWLDFLPLVTIPLSQCLP